MRQAAAPAAAAAFREDNMWQAIAVTPPDFDIEVAVIDRQGEHAVVIPCRRATDGWIDAATRRYLDIHPTHWRPWRPRQPDER